MSLTNRPAVLLRAEAFLELASCVTAFAHLYPGRWGFFALFFLVPDVSLLAWLLPGEKLRSGLYNACHIYCLPLALGLLAWQTQSARGGEIALIWMSHIAFDRLLGYGLKYPGEFRRTHLQRAAEMSGSQIEAPRPG